MRGCDGEALEQQRLGRREPLAAIVGGVDRAEEDIDPRRADERVDVGRVELDRLLEQLAGLVRLSSRPLLKAATPRK